MRLFHATNMRSISLAALAIASLGAAPVSAQEAPQAKPSADEIIVTGIRASLATAIDRKKNASTTVDSIVAEDVAKFPDKNIGEAVSRITGVQLTRDFGEGTQVSIRGVEPDLNRIEVNGASTLGVQGGRGADFRELAAELISAVDVYKGYVVNLTEGGVGGTVSIKTRKPLELKRPLLVVNVSGQSVDSIGGVQPRATLVAGTKFFEDRIGVLLNATYDHARTRGDFVRNTEWVRLGDLNQDGRKNTENPNFANITSLSQCGSVPTSAAAGATRADCQLQFYDFSPRIPRLGLWERDDKRLSLEGTVQAEITDNLRAYVGLQYNERKQRLIDYNYSFDLTALHRFTLGSSVDVDDAGNVIGFTTAPIVTNNAGAANQGAGSIIGASKRDFAYNLKSRYINAGFDWQLDRLRVEGLMVLSKADLRSDSNSLGLSASPGSVRFQIDPETGTPSWTFPAGFDPNSVAAYEYKAAARAAGPVVQYRPSENDSTEDQFKIDFDYEVDFPFIKSLEYGLQHRKATSLSYGGGGYLAINPDGTTTTVPTLNININTAVTGGPTNLTNPRAPIWSPARLAEFLQQNTNLTPGTFYNQPGFDRSGLPAKWLSPSFNNLNDFFELSDFNRDCIRMCNGYAQPPAFDITEKIFAGYVMANFEQQLGGMELRGNFGLRVVETRDNATGINTIRERRPAPTPANPSATVDVIVGQQIISLKNRYVDYLPAFNAALFVTPEVIVRGNWAKVIARPKFSDLAPNSNCLFDTTPDGSIDDILDGCTAGNPYLKPYRASQWDLNVGWYPNRDTAFTIGYYQKNIDTFVLSRTLVRDVDFFGDGRRFDVTMPINGTGAVQRGIEASAQSAFTFLPAPFDGLGAIVNYTYGESSNVGLVNQLTGEKLPYPYLSKHTANFTAYYEKHGISIRVPVQYRSPYLVNAAERSGNAVFRDSTIYVDARAGYTFSVGPVRELELFVEAKNLTGENERSYAGDIRETEIAYAGRRYFAGARFVF